MPRKVKKQPFLLRRGVLWPALVVVVGLATFFVLKQTVLKPTVPAASTNTSTSSQTSKQSSTQQTSANNPAPNGYGQDKGSGSTAPTTTSGTAPVIPSGLFVSNHHPNLSGYPAPNLITSSCTTTPGASCKITFTKDGVTRSLAAETTDANGSAFWNNWKLQDVGLTDGSWTVQAVATLNGQTKTATDAQSLVVAQ